MRKHRIASLLLGAIITIGSVSVFSGSVAGATTVGDMSGFQLVSNGSVKYSISTALATAEDGPTKDYERDSASGYNVQHVRRRKCNADVQVYVFSKKGDNRRQ